MLFRFVRLRCFLPPFFGNNALGDDEIRFGKIVPWQMRKLWRAGADWNLGVHIPKDTAHLPHLGKRGATRPPVFESPSPFANGGCADASLA